MRPQAVYPLRRGLEPLNSNGVAVGYLPEGQNILDLFQLHGRLFGRLTTLGFLPSNSEAVTQPQGLLSDT